MTLLEIGERLKKEFPNSDYVSLDITVRYANTKCIPQIESKLTLYAWDIGQVCGESLDDVIGRAHKAMEAHAPLKQTPILDITDPDFETPEPTGTGPTHPPTQEQIDAMGIGSTEQKLTHNGDFQP